MYNLKEIGVNPIEDWLCLMRASPGSRANSKYEHNGDTLYSTHSNMIKGVIQKKTSPKKAHAHHSHTF